LNDWNWANIQCSETPFEETIPEFEEIKATTISVHDVEQSCEVWNYPIKYILFIKGYDGRIVY